MEHNPPELVQNRLFPTMEGPVPPGPWRFFIGIEKRGTRRKAVYPSSRSLPPSAPQRSPACSGENVTTPLQSTRTYRHHHLQLHHHNHTSSGTALGKSYPLLVFHVAFPFLCKRRVTALHLSIVTRNAIQPPANSQTQNLGSGCICLTACRSNGRSMLLKPDFAFENWPGCLTCRQNMVFGRCVI